MSPEYATALEKANKASAAFRAAQTAYRARKIGDVEFCEAKRLFDASTVEFDAAFAKEEAR